MFVDIAGTKPDYSLLYSAAKMCFTQMIEMYIVNAKNHPVDPRHVSLG